VGAVDFLGELVTKAYEEAQAEEVSPTLLLERKRAYNFNKRQKADPEAKRRKELLSKRSGKLSDISVDKARDAKCCPRNCCRNMSFQAVLNTRMDYYALPCGEQQTFLLDLLRMRDENIIRSGKMIFGNKVVCREAFYELLGVSRSTFYRRQKSWEEGSKVGFHGNTGTRKTRGNTLTAQAHMTQILTELAEPLPHEQCFKLPSCYNKVQIYNELCESLQKLEVATISKSTFHYIWRTQFPNYTFHRSSAFAKCDLCLSFKVRLSTEKRPNARAIIEEERRQHIDAQGARRNLYYAHRLLAKKRLEKYLNVIHYKMDQHKTGIPRLIELVKSMSSACTSVPIALT
jgi:hypothetical protein